MVFKNSKIADLTQIIEKLVRNYYLLFKQNESFNVSKKKC